MAVLNLSSALEPGLPGRWSSCPSAHGQHTDLLWQLLLLYLSTIRYVFKYLRNYLKVVQNQTKDPSSLVAWAYSRQ